MFWRMKDPVEGVARLVSYVETNVRNEFVTTVIAQVIVEADGVPPTAVELRPGIPESQLPLMPGTEWRVRVDRANPKKVKIIDDSRERGDAELAAGRAEAERIAAAMRGETADPDRSP